MTSFGPDQVIHEYQILRDSIAFVAKARAELDEDKWAIADRSINTAMHVAVRTLHVYMKSCAIKWLPPVPQNAYTVVGDCQRCSAYRDDVEIVLE